ncbi:hypothetical protein [Novosphingobium sp. BW1]|uniref:hypothetical protein n=1 Tax=Novosphingobium sp. BW1 TaxID=2592621 RepID=UPI0011DEC456|nr:hypothetical protein [Novosphingobium sp. BW1]TYC93057.1 hypothetical protein FMM79_03455 [Novosphingobium sp. BW1]
MIYLRWPDHFPVRATEWLLASMKTSWGLILLMHVGAFNNQFMSAMRQIGNESAWGWIAFIAGAAHLTSLYVNGTRRRSPHLRAFCSGVGTLFWFQVCLGIFATGLPNTGWAIYPWLFVFSTRNMLVAIRDARRSDENFKAGTTICGKRK